MLPSIKRLNLAFPGKGKELRQALEADRKTLLQHPAGAARLAECYHPPKTYDIRLHVLDAIAETCGVEYISHDQDTVVESWGIDYLDVGDPYSLTVIRFCGSGLYRVACWGDIVERSPKLGHCC